MKNRRSNRSGFTLVEMLVAVGLVVLMLVLFGEVFSIATASMSKMKGVAENDQRARMLNILIRGDLQSRTFRQVPGEFGIHALQANTFDDDPRNTFVSTYQRGYVYISENNPNDQTDDLIQFTIDVSQATNNFETPTIYGRALQFGSDTTPQADGLARDVLQHNPNQPVFDDQAGRYTTGALTSDQTGSSSYAEVSYFLRNGNLYRRQLLIRQPIDPTAPNNPTRPDGTALSPNATQVYGTAFVWNPSSPSGTDNPLSTGSFWGDFDYSAVWDPSNGLRFNGVNSSTGNALENGTGGKWNAATGAQPKTASSLGYPGWRFGFIPQSFALKANVGPTNHSMEYTPAAGTSGSLDYFGRFTQQETSASNFSWPGSPPGDGSKSDGNPMSSQFVSLQNGVAAINGNAYSGTRVSQDLLATNVHEFDVKVWDDWATNPITGMTGMFVDIGGQNAFKYLTSNNQNYGSNNPFGFGANVYDTWHPAATDNTFNILAAPFRNLVDNGNDNSPGKAGVDDDSKNGVDDPGEQGYPGTDDWHDMKAVAIHIRYYDTPSNSMRDLTIIHSFVE